MQITLNSNLQPTQGDSYYTPERLAAYLHTKLLSIACQRDTEPKTEYKLLDANFNTNLSKTGFVGLASKCYSRHLPLAIAPHDIWVIILSEISKEVSLHPEQYRSLFTVSKDKTDISVPSSSATEIPLSILSQYLSNKVLFDSIILFPNFSTETPIITETFQSIFCDMASPYYSYSMFCCGIPSIQILGTETDWLKIKSNLHKICNLFNSPSLYAYLTKMDSILNEFISSFNKDPNLDFWTNFFTQKNQGSGRELFIDGWIKDLFIKTLSVSKLENYSNNFGVVKYKQLGTKINYMAIYGGFDSIINYDGFYQLDYKKYILQKI